MPITTVTAQGRVLEVKVSYPTLRPGSQANRPDVPRGTITGFSRASRRRLLSRLMRIKWAQKNNKFITLTYPASFPGTGHSKEHLRNFLKRWRRSFPDSAVVWRLAFQKRGAPHFHLVSPNLPYQNKRSIQSAWGEIIGYKEPFTRIDAFEGLHVVSYVTRYAAKVEDAEKEGSGQICATIKPRDDGGGAWTGRCWGVHNEQSMPYHCRHQTTSAGLELYYDLRARASEVWPGLRDVPEGSFTLYVDDAADWAGLLS